MFRIITQQILKLSIHRCETKKTVEQIRQESRNCFILYLSRVIYKVMKNAYVNRTLLSKILPSLSRFLHNSLLIDFL
jgi:hypothetical protein